MNKLERILATAVMAMFGVGCTGYNIRMSTLMIDREGKRDYMIGLGSLAKGGDYSQYAIINIALDNRWYCIVTPFYNSHTEAKEQEGITTLEFGSIAIAEGSCLQFGYVNFRRNENPWWKKVSPVVGWHKTNGKEAQK